MNILYITAMQGVKFSGLTAAVPRHIESQSHYDNVFWYNVIELKNEIENCLITCHTIKEYPDLDISKLPSPFDKPDLVIYEDFYYVQFLRIAKQIKRLKIPYVIVPHCCLCKQAQDSKSLKKRVGNILFFNRFAQGAATIHYLTEREYKDSGNRWNKNHFILPNGAAIDGVTYEKKEHNGFKGVFIGRLDIQHKGLDILIEAVARLKQLFIKNDSMIEIYGADSEGDGEKLHRLISEYGVNDVLTVNPPVYDDAKKDVLEKADYFVLTSRYEGHPMGLIEALAYGIPSLVTYGTNMGEEISKYSAGWVSESTVEGVCVSLKEMFESKDQFTIYSENAKRLASNYNWLNIAKEAHENYMKLITFR